MSYPHRTRFSDASTFDEICMKCGATDGYSGTLYDGPCEVSDKEWEREKKEKGNG